MKINKIDLESEKNNLKEQNDFLTQLKTSFEDIKKEGFINIDLRMSD